MSCSATSRPWFTAPADHGSNDITGYEFSVDDGVTWDDLTTSDIDTDPVTGTITGLTNGDNYDVKVRAVSAAGDGAASASMGGSPTAPVVVELPGQVKDLVATAGSGQAVLTFPVPDEGDSATTGYEVSFDGGSWSPLTTTGTDPLSATITGLTNGTLYHVRVRAFSADGPGDASDAVDVTPKAATFPGPPNLSQVGSYRTPTGGILFAIDNPIDDGGSAITGYQLSVDDDIWSYITYNPATPNQALGFDFSNVGVCSLRSYRLRAVNAAGKSDPSNPIRFQSRWC